MNVQKKIAIIAGPNGAGKTTFAREYLPKEADCPDFINVDLIAAGLSPFDPDKASLRASRLVLLEIQRRVRMGRASHSKQPCPDATTPVLFRSGEMQAIM
jgi:predicted ABC-type ATPase